MPSRTSLIDSIDFFLASPTNTKGDPPLDATPPGDAIDAALSDFDWDSGSATPSKTVPSGL